MVLVFSIQCYKKREDKMKTRAKIVIYLFLDKGEGAGIKQQQGEGGRDKTTTTKNKHEIFVLWNVIGFKTFQENKQWSCIFDVSR